MCNEILFLIVHFLFYNIFMGKYSDRAKNYFYEGYNCAQAVFLAFAEDIGFEKNIALKISSSFGGGMGRLREVCGAVSSMFALAGYFKGYTEPNNDEVKAKHYEYIQSLAEKFKAKHKTIICRELLDLEPGADSPIPEKRTPEYYKSRPCAKFIETAASIIESEFADYLN